MRINKHTNNTKRNLIILTVAALTVITGGMYYVYVSNAQPPTENVVNYESATDEQKNSGLKSKEDFINNHYGNGTDEGSGDASDREVGVLISSLNQVEGVLTVATSIEAMDTGVCELQLSRSGSETVTMQSQVVNMTTYSACEDFNIDIAGLSKGEWDLRVEFLGGSSKGTTNTKVGIK